MKKYLIYILIFLFAFTGEILFSGCGSHRIQKRHIKHGRFYTKHLIKKRARSTRKLRKRKSIRSKSTTKRKKIKIKKFGGTYIIR
ncbi:MAG: hypothetical protein PHD97_00950 [Bacteroidales bacterium]|nr:hypothetical protein [Bacteroidales bacterium]